MHTIQPCALILQVGPQWQVEMASANVGLLGDFRPAAIVGEPLANLIGGDALHALRNRLSWLAGDESTVYDFGVQWGEVALDLRAVSDEGGYLIECELAVESRLSDAIGMVRSMSERLDKGTPAEMAEKAMRQLRALTGFDRVNLFDAKGELIASANGNHDGEVASRLLPDHTFALIVADRDADPVPFVGEVGADVLDKASYLAPTDAVREKMAAQDVASAMSLPLRIDGRLVATVEACHSTPQRCGAERRSVAHLFAERLVARMTRTGWSV